MEVQRSLRDLRSALLASRGLQRSTGKPLYTYRFNAEEYIAIKSMLGQWKARALDDWDGRALFVAFVAEWFRREREDGKWEWIRPCAEIGIVYGAANATVAYPKIREAVQHGLQAWGRKAPDEEAVGFKWLMAVIAECGFPAADVQRGGRLQAWLAAALQMIERGHDAAEAVGMESWRVSEQLVDATMATAIELCAALANLRAELRASGAEKLGVDPIAYFDAAKPTWRDELPIVAEDRHARALVDDLVRAEEPPASLLAITRVLRKDGETWKSAARIALEGSSTEAALPAALKALHGAHHRLFVRPRGSLSESHAGVIASLDREQNFAGDVEWRLSRRITAFEPSCPFDHEIRLGLEVDGAHVADVVPDGGDAIPECLSVFRLRDAVDPRQAREVVFLSTASVRVRDPWLVLVGTPAVLSGLVVEGERFDLPTNADLVALAFKGRASLHFAGSKYSWTTESNDERADDLVLDGVHVAQLREDVFAGMPRVALYRNGAKTNRKIEKLHWRPPGRGDWRTGVIPPYGRIELAEIADGEVIARRLISVLPPDIVIGATGARRLSIAGVDAAIGASHVHDGARAPLPARTYGANHEIDLSALGIGELVELDIAWGETRLRATLRDPTTDAALVGPDGRVQTSAVRLSIGALGGWRAYAATSASLHVELPPKAGRRVGATLSIAGETPLIAYRDQIKAILASAEDDGGADATARVEWLGDATRVADIGWYAASPATPKSIEAISLVRPAEKKVVVTSRIELQDALAQAGGGPFIVFETDDEISWSRPTFKGATPFDDVGLTPLQLACAGDMQAPRREAIATRLRQNDLGLAELRFVRDVITTAAGRAPLASFDLLRILCFQRDPAVATLAAGDTIEERTAVLGLEDELPFIWGATRLAAWREAFDRRVELITQTLDLADEGRALAVASVVGALRELCNSRPALCGHAYLVAERWMPKEWSPTRDKALIGLAQRLSPVCSGPGLKASADGLMRRRAEELWPQLDLAPLLGAEMHKIPFDLHRRDVIAAPHVAALIALDQLEATREALSACRVARMFDPLHFDDALPRALKARASGATCFSEGAFR